MTFTSACLLGLKQVVINPVESVAAIAAVIFLNAYVIQHIIKLWTGRPEASFQDVSRRRKRKLAQMDRAGSEDVQRRLDALTFEDCDRQAASPLFTALPGEIRNEVFRWALVQYEDEADAYSPDSYWYRPGFRGPRKSSRALLQTCRLAYLEARRVTAREAEHAFWFNRGPRGRTGMGAFGRFFDALDARAARDILSVRFFTQMYWIEGGTALNRAMRHPNFVPERLTVTFRYSDWWFWEHGEPLRMSEEWLKDFRGPPSMRELVVEYESLSWKREEMMFFVTRNKKWELRLRDGAGSLSAEGTPLREWRWRGPSKLDGVQWPHHPADEEMEYVVLVDRWVWRAGDVTEEEKARQVEESELSDKENTGRDEDDTDHASQDYDSYSGSDEVDSQDESEDADTNAESEHSSGGSEHSSGGSEHSSGGSEHSSGDSEHSSGDEGSQHSQSAHDEVGSDDGSVGDHRSDGSEEAVRNEG